MENSIKTVRKWISHFTEKKTGPDFFSWFSQNNKNLLEENAFSDEIRENQPLNSLKLKFDKSQLFFLCACDYFDDEMERKLKICAILQLKYSSCWILDMAQCFGLNTFCFINTYKSHPNYYVNFTSFVKWHIRSKVLVISANH